MLQFRQIVKGQGISAELDNLENAVSAFEFEKARELLEQIGVNAGILVQEQG